MRFLGILCAVFCMAACTSTSTTNPVDTVVCSAETVATTTMAAAIASAAGCKNVSQMQVDIQGWLGKANLCQAAAVQAQLKAISNKSMAAGKEKGIVASIVCPIVIDSIQSGIGQTFPTAWQCSGSALTATALSTACLAIPI